MTRVRAALGPDPAPATDIPRAYRTTTHDALEAFLERLVHYDARAIQTIPGELDATVRATLNQRDARNIVAPDGVPPGWLTTVNPIHDKPPLDHDSLDGADGVVTTCALAIAQTGTIVLDGGLGMGRRALTLLPDYHLCVVRAEQLVGSVPEALARLAPTRPLTFISGPSATVDIEMVRVKGVHGPRTLDVILVARE
ncbi:MAG TPA: LUD domain-containing protein [Actinomycetota bacterium]|nr:LUD domain-containing protein [Actinomycetota bacterium]